MSDIEIGADHHEDAQSIRRQELIEDYMTELGCTRLVAEALVEREIGCNPDAHWGEVF